MDAIPRGKGPTAARLGGSVFPSNTCVSPHPLQQQRGPSACSGSSIASPAKGSLGRQAGQVSWGLSWRCWW